MKVMLLLHGEGHWLSSDKLIDLVKRHVDFFEGLSDKVVCGGILSAPERGYVLERRASGEKLLPAPVHDGPLVFGGYYVLEVESLEAAEAIARALPMVERLVIELRPMMGHVLGGGKPGLSPK